MIRVTGRAATWAGVSLVIGRIAMAAEGAQGPVPPEKAAATIHVPAGLHVELVASEPMVVDPVAMTIDENGVIFVAEMRDYPDAPAIGRIRRLEDSDGDGRPDRATVFADAVPTPNGVMAWNGGVLVTSAPDILFLQDSNGDGVADIRRVVFTGFAVGNTDHRTNGLVFGLDNWIYGANGGGGGRVRPGDQPQAKPLGLWIRDYRFRPDFSGLESVSGHSQFANTFDDWGNRFVNDNSNHLRHPVLPRRNLLANPQFALESPEQSLPDHGDGAEVFPLSAPAERPNDPLTAGHFTSACAVTIYRGDALPAAYRGNAFVAEPAHNLIHRDVLEAKGPTFVARRAHQTSEFLASTDSWVRPVNMYGGPDGALYVVDMYRAVLEHPMSIPFEMQKRLDLDGGKNMGRIYRVVPDGWRPPHRRPDLGRLPSSALVPLLADTNAWWRMTAQRLLIERQDKTVADALRGLARTRPKLARLHALWTLEGLGQLDDATLTRALSDREAGIRENALRLAESRLGTAPRLRQAAFRLVDDPSPRVRFQLALAAGGLGDEVLPTLARLIRRDGADPWQRNAVLTSARHDRARLLELVLATAAGFARRPEAAEFIRHLGEIVATSGDRAEIAAWIRVATGRGGATPETWRVATVASLGPALRHGTPELRTWVRAPGVLDPMRGWSNALWKMAQDPSAHASDRAATIEFLALFPDPVRADVLEKLLDPRHPESVQVAAARALADCSTYAFSTRLLASWARFTAAVRDQILATLIARGDREIEDVLAALEKGLIRPSDINLARREVLTKHATLGPRAREVFVSRSASQLDGTVAKVTRQVLALDGDALHGENVYNDTCAVCHRFRGQGHPVGPALETVIGRENQSLLTDILNPNRAVAPQYQVYVVKTASQELSGIVATEDPTSITLRAAMAVDTTVQRNDVVALQAHPVSMMPEGLEQTLRPQDLADLLAFLGAKRDRR